ncbi:TetR/AcrR family transcriptional regulator [Leifsonia sp. 2MCAF36]|uniref:TetR/AcrR family transcriptional regulator n=1 Tax=Leifsonia sp. 2MCAF36 TaxID=3232988 RepID=UPI003F9C2D4A
MTPRDRWINEGLSVLRAEGIAGVRIDRIAARLGLTKGSFHHHFDGVSDYHRSLLECYESEAVARIEGAAASLSRVGPQRVLVDASAQISSDAVMEAAIRGWAFDDETARATVSRIDAARLDVLRHVWQSIVPNEAQARAAALIPHLILIGASVAVPRPTAQEMTDVFALLGTLIPSVPGAEPPEDRPTDRV